MKLHLRKPTRKEVKRFLIYTLIVVIGNALAAGGSAFFIIPNNFVMGGTTGIGIFVRNLLGGNKEWVVTLTVYVANIALFILGSILLGKKFAAATLAGTLLYPSFISLWTFVNNLLEQYYGGPIAADQPLLGVIFGSLLFGGGIGMVVRIGASTGGTDIPPLIFHKYFNLPVSVTMMVLDVSICVIQFFAGVTVEYVLYGILITILSAIIVEKVSPVGMKRTQVQIVSKKYKEIREMILYTLNRGATLLSARTGFLQEKCFVVMTIVSNRDVVKLRNEVHKIDPEAFIMVNVISEVRGRGFSSERIALPKQEKAFEEEKGGEPGEETKEEP